MPDDVMGAVAGIWAYLAREPVYPLLSLIVLLVLACAIQRNRIAILHERLRAADGQTAAMRSALGASSGSDALVRIGELIGGVETLRNALRLITDRLEVSLRDASSAGAAADAATSSADLRAAEEALDRRIKALDRDMAEVVAFSYAEAEETVERPPVAA
jgi:hypothetical protein